MQTLRRLQLMLTALCLLAFAAAFLGRHRNPEGMIVPFAAGCLSLILSMALLFAGAKRAAICAVIAFAIMLVSVVVLGH